MAQLPERGPNQDQEAGDHKAYIGMTHLSCSSVKTHTPFLYPGNCSYLYGAYQIRIPDPD